MPAAVRNSVFVTFKRGLQTLVKGLVDALATVDLRPGVGVVSVRNGGTQAEVIFEDGHREIVDGDYCDDADVIKRRSYLADFPAASKLAKIDYISVANVIMAFDRKDIPFELDASGFLVPKQEGYDYCLYLNLSEVAACCARRKGAAALLYRSFGEQEWPAWSDEELIRKARHDIKDLLGITAEPPLRK